MPANEFLTAALKNLTPDQRLAIQSALQPRLPAEYIRHIPHAKQQVFLNLNCKEALYGGAAGGGKSDAILMAALQYADVPGYSALILRRTWPDLNAAGAILDRARTWLSPTNAKIRDGGRNISFPSGARLSFGHLQHEDDKFKYQSAEYQFIGWDELTHFDESQYTYIFSRLRRPDLVCLNCGKAVRKNGERYRHRTKPRRGACSGIFPDPKVIEQYGSAPDGTSIFDVPLRVRSGTNPGGRGNEWVKRRLVDETTREAGAIFVPASLNDNPSIDRREYRESLQHLSEVDRLRLENGDWDVAEAGDFFARHWFKVQTTRTPDIRGVRKCRFWDMASTEGGGDYTVGALLAAFPDGYVEIQDIVRGQWGSAAGEAMVRNTAAQDGPNVAIRMEQEPGSAGKNLISHFRRSVVPGYNFDGKRATGTKSDRAYPWKVAAERGMIRVVAQAGTTAFLNEAEAFPNGANDDQIDAISGAWGEVHFGQRARLLA
jgi:predicted phage terminase large subunit-like protein